MLKRIQGDTAWYHLQDENRRSDNSASRLDADFSSRYKYSTDSWCVIELTRYFAYKNKIKKRKTFQESKSDPINENH